MRKVAHLFLPFALVFVGCATEDAPDAVSPAADAAVADVDVASGGVVLGEEENFGDYFAAGGYLAGDSIVNVIRQVSFDQKVEAGVCWGFNLDGQVSEEGDEQSCLHADMVSPDGVEGIDNKFSELFADFKEVYGPQITDLLHEAINEGRLLLLIELEGVDDLENDDDITVRWHRGSLAPHVGHSGFLLSDQTYYLDPSMEPSVIEHARIVDGVVEVGPFDYGVPLEIFDADMIMEVETGFLRFRIREDGSLSGIFGGGLRYQPLLEVLYDTGASSEAYLLTPFIELMADMLYEDGVCHGLSMGISFDTAPGYLVRFPE